MRPASEGGPYKRNPRAQTGTTQEHSRNGWATDCGRYKFIRIFLGWPA